jgi:hypothetical protein
LVGYYPLDMDHRKRARRLLRKEVLLKKPNSRLDWRHNFRSSVIHMTLPPIVYIKAPINI